MLPDRERDQLRVQAKNLSIKLRREFEQTKAQGREDATRRRPGEDTTTETPIPIDSGGGVTGGTAESAGTATLLPATEQR